MTAPKDRAGEVEAALRGRLSPHRIMVSVRSVSGADVDPARLMAAEAAAIASAVPARRAEFSAGRAAARGALHQLQVGPVPIPVAPDRSPEWPAGIVGSLTHAHDVAIAVAARAEHVAALGVDVEPDEDLPAELCEEILSADEISLLGPGQAGLRGARRAFCGKEAIFKALFPSVRHFVGFEGARFLEPPPPTGSARVRVGPEFGPNWAGRTLTVEFLSTRGVMLAFVRVPLDSMPETLE